jgi:formate transporter
MTLVCGGELFTGNTCFLAAAVAEKRATMGELVKNWTLSYAGNVVGTLFMVGLCCALDVYHSLEDKM